MSHRSFGSLHGDAPLEGETSVQNVDGAHVAFDVPLEEDFEEDKPTRVQGFFGVRPWSIRLTPSNPVPIADTTPSSGTLQALGNWIWVIFFGWWIALLHAILGCLMFITVIGIPYGKFSFSLVKYWLWPFGRFVIGPYDSANESTTLLSDGNPFNRRTASTPLKTNKLNPGYWLWTFFASILVAPFMLLATALNWVIVLSVPMAKAHWTMLRVMYEKPLDISIEKEYGVNAASAEVVLCTYNAYSTGYVKYSFMGLNIFLVNLFPVVIGVAAYSMFPDRFHPKPQVLFPIYLVSCIPITFYIGMAISCIAAQTNYMIGALLNASFGSMTELILYGSAIRQGGLDELVKYSVTGGLLSDTLLLPGLSMIAGGIKYKEQKFNPVAAGASSLLLFIAVVGIFSPTIWYQVYGGYNQSCNQCQLVWGGNVTDPSLVDGSEAIVHNISHILCNMCYNMPPDDLDQDPRYHDSARKMIYFCAAILPVAYIVGLVFTFFTHSHIFQQEEHGEEEDLPTWGLPFAVVFMMINTVMFGMLAEGIVHVVKPTLEAFGVPQSFLGLTLIALVPATTEIVNAIKFALVNQISLSVEIGSASAIQISLIQIPFLVIISAAVHGSRTVGSFVLIFPLLTVFAVILAVITSNYISAEGRTSYFTGTSLVIIYAIFICAFYFIPQTDNPLASSPKHNVVMSMMQLGRLGGGAP
jgi:Ca2+:H+ antiporter